MKTYTKKDIIDVLNGYPWEQIRGVATALEIKKSELYCRYRVRKDNGSWYVDYQSADESWRTISGSATQMGAYDFINAQKGVR